MILKFEFWDTLIPWLIKKKIWNNDQQEEYYYHDEVVKQVDKRIVVTI